MIVVGNISTRSHLDVPLLHTGLGDDCDRDDKDYSAKLQQLPLSGPALHDFLVSLSALHQWNTMRTLVLPCRVVAAIVRAHGTLVLPKLKRRITMARRLRPNQGSVVLPDGTEHMNVGEEVVKG